MKKSKEQEGSNEELISFLGDCLIDACKLGDEPNLLCLDDIREMVGISDHEWVGIKSQVEEYMGERYEGAKLLTEQHPKRKGECAQILNIYIGNKTLSCHLKDAMDEDANGVTMEFER